MRDQTTRSHAAAKREAALAFVEKLDVPFYCFHDVDVMADAEDAAAFRASFAEAVDHLEALQAQHGRKLLWGTANLFSHPRYMAGAATNPDPEVYAWAAMQVRDASRRPTGWAAPTMCCGAGARAMTRSSTPRSASSRRTSGGS